LLFRLRTSQLTTMPTCDGFLMAFPLEQFLAACHLRIITVLDLEPRGALSCVRREAVLRYNPFKIHLADALEQRRTVLLYLVGISQS